MRQAPISLIFTNSGTVTTAMPATGTLLSQIISLESIFGFCVMVYWSGTPTGTFTLQGSNDVGQAHASGAVTGVTNFTTVLNSSQSTTGIQSIAYNLDGQYYRWFQVVYTASSGTGTLTNAMANVKGF